MLLSQVFIYVKAPMHGDFSIFKMAAAAILDFQNLKFLTFETVKRNCVTMPNFIEIALTAAEI